MADTDRLSETPEQYPLWSQLGRGLSKVGEYADKPDPTMPGGLSNPPLHYLSEALGLKEAGTFLQDLGQEGYGWTAKRLLENTERGRQARYSALNLLPVGVGAAKTAYKAAEPLSMAAGSPVSGTVRMFMGQKAKTFDPKWLTAAEDLESQGAKPQDIWKATGMFRSADGKWRWELDDSKIPFSAKAAFERKHATTRQRLQTLSDAQDVRAIMERGGEDAATVFARYAKQVKDQQGRAVSPLVKNYAQANDLPGLDYLERMAKNRLLAPFETTVGEVFPHNELFAAYPHLKDMKIEFQSDKVPEGWGHFDKDYGIRTKELALRPEQKSLILHELQHAVQRHEGFDPGAAPSGIEKAKGVTSKEADELYFRNMGEAEARATQARMKLGADARRMTFPLQEHVWGYDRPINMLLPVEKLYSADVIKLAKTLGTTPENVVRVHPEMAIEQPK